MRWSSCAGLRSTGWALQTGRLRCMRTVSLAAVLVGAMILTAPPAAAGPEACTALGGVIEAGDICGVHASDPAYTMDVTFPLGYPDEQVIIDYLGQTRDGFVRVAHEGDAESAVGSVIGDSRGDGIVGRVRAEDRNRRESGLRCRQCVRQSFAHDQLVRVAEVRGDGKRQPGVRCERRRWVVVLAAHHIGFEIPALDVGDVARRVERGKGSCESGAGR